MLSFTFNSILVSFARNSGIYTRFTTPTKRRWICRKEQRMQEAVFLIFKVPKNRLRNPSASLCSLVGRYDNPIPILFLAPIDCSKIPAQWSHLSCCKGSLGIILRVLRLKPKGGGGGGCGFLSGFPPFSFTVYTNDCRNCKRLREFKEKEISRQSCTVGIGDFE